VESVQPALVEVTTRVGSLRRIPAGTDFDVASLRSSSAETRVGVLPLEFSNSVLVRKPNQVVTLAGQTTPALHVSLEHSVIDVTGLADVDEGATIHLISYDRNRGPLLTEFSRVQGRPSVELLVSMTGKVQYKHRELVWSWACRA
jgi:alanine racemase